MIEWQRYHVEVEFDDRVVGGIPVVPGGADRADAYEKWARRQGVEPGDATELAESLADDGDMPVTVAEVEGLETGFRSDENGLYLEARQVNAMLRESAQRLGLIKKVRGLRQVVQHDLHVRAVDGTQKIRLGVAAPTGVDSRPISVVTRQGPRTAIKRFAYVNGSPTIEFRVQILAGGVGNGLVGEEELRSMLELGGMLGLGADRSQGEGTFHLVNLESL